MWIALSDPAVHLLFRSPATVLIAGTVKGVAFVAFTSALMLAPADLRPPLRCA